MKTPKSPTIKEMRACLKELTFELGERKNFIQQLQSQSVTILALIQNHRKEIARRTK